MAVAGDEGCLCCKRRRIDDGVGWVQAVVAGFFGRTQGNGGVQIDDGTGHRKGNQPLRILGGFLAGEPLV